MTTYRPSARIRLTLRTEEYENTSALEAALPPGEVESPFAPPAASAPSAPTTPATSNDASALLVENSQRRLLVETDRPNISSSEYERQIAALDAERSAIMSSLTASAEATTPPVSVAGSAPDDLTVFGDIEPVSIQIERNGLASADTASLVLDYADAPIDPRILRAAHVDFVLGVVGATNYEGGMERLERRPDGSLTSLVDAPAEGSLLGGTRFVGFVDNWDVRYSGDGDAVSVECRDMSALLRDIPMPPGRSIDLDLPIDEGVGFLLDTVSASSQGIEVTYLGEGDPPTPSDGAPRRRRARRGRVARRARRGNEDMSVWDHITDVVRGLGLLPVSSDYALQITEPRTLYSASDAKRMVYGRNLESLSFSRKLSGTKVPTIEVRSYDPDRGRTLWARYPVRSGETASGVLGIDNPPRPLRANEITPSGANPDESIKVIIVSGVTDPALLERVARNSFEQIGRQEIEGTFETFDTWSFDSTPTISDLLDLRAGDAVELLVVAASSPDDEEFGSTSTLARIQAMDRARRVDYLLSLGWTRQVAERFAALQDATGFQTVFRVQDVRISWDRESGVKLSCSFVNYITVREDAAS